MTSDETLPKKHCQTQRTCFYCCCWISFHQTLPVCHIQSKFMRSDFLLKNATGCWGCFPLKPGRIPSSYSSSLRRTLTPCDDGSCLGQCPFRCDASSPFNQHRKHQTDSSRVCLYGTTNSEYYEKTRSLKSSQIFLCFRIFFLVAAWWQKTHHINEYIQIAGVKKENRSTD